MRQLANTTMFADTEDKSNLTNKEDTSFNNSEAVKANRFFSSRKHLYHRISRGKEVRQLRFGLCSCVDNGQQSGAWLRLANLRLLSTCKHTEYLIRLFVDYFISVGITGVF